MRALAAALALAVLAWPVLLMAAGAARAQQPAGCRATLAPLAEELSERWVERQAGAGLTGGGALLQLWVGETTWSLVVILPGGAACLVGEGTDWTPTLPAPASKEGA